MSPAQCSVCREVHGSSCAICKTNGPEKCETALNVSAADCRPAIWMIAPDVVNLAFFGLEQVVIPSLTGRAATMFLSLLEPDEAKELIGERSVSGCPMCIAPERLSERMKAQQGVFTIHGTDSRALDTILVEKINRGEDGQTLPYVPIAKFEMECTLKTMWNEFDKLEALGISEMTIMPEYVSVANYLKRSLIR